MISVTGAVHVTYLFSFIHRMQLIHFHQLHLKRAPKCLTSLQVSVYINCNPDSDLPPSARPDCLPVCASAGLLKKSWRGLPESATRSVPT